uniref:Sulfotransferase family protein n=1 Tax=Candidatus Kentrum sp. DK TaxID=2126562 RepID=A0A450TH00_9GAMM|nr:MAG: Sulfotransferase family protein [Candidatus Kentron sp. DK]
MKKTFLLGVGAQKAGTSWLYQQLKKSEDFANGFRKEYHIFDALTIKECKSFLTQTQKRCRRLLDSEFDTWSQSPDLKALTFYADTNNYFCYFEKLLNESDANLVADITPSYSGLSSETLSYIKKQFAKRGIDVKVIFIMREPINRLLSALKMHFRRKGLTIESEPIIKEMKLSIGKNWETLRSNYRETCSNIIDVFDEQQRCFCFYETMFSPGEMLRIFDFFGIDASCVDVEEMVNHTPGIIRIDKDSMKIFEENFTDRYNFVKSNFNGDIHDLWMMRIDEITAKTSTAAPKSVCNFWHPFRAIRELY